MCTIQVDAGYILRKKVVWGPASLFLASFLTAYGKKHVMPKILSYFQQIREKLLEIE